MATTTQSHLDLTSFKALSFDCYGTLIDWENGFISDLQPLLTQLPPTHPYNLEPLAAVSRFNSFGQALSASQPALPYDQIQIAAYQSLAAELALPAPPAAELAQIGTAQGRWPAFEDTVDGLQRLKSHYKLIILSNVTNQNIARTVEDQLSPVRFDAVYTAEEIGSYKPDHANFRYLFRRARDELGVDFEKGDLLHVARSLTADHVPAKELGLQSVWIARGGDREGRYGSGGNLKELTEKGKLGFARKFQTIGEFADEVDLQFASKK